jgi:hypothetical protein
VKKWLNEGHHQDYCSASEHAIAQAYAAGADQELEACCEWLCNVERWKTVAEGLRTSRRPKPPSLAKRALHILGTHGDLSCAEHDTIRRALEALPE